MLIAKELLIGKVAKRKEEYSYTNYESKIGFPTFQKLSPILGAKLLPKTEKTARGVMKLTLEEA